MHAGQIQSRHNLLSTKGGQAQRQGQQGQTGAR